jgi:hypothetical protein
VKLFHCHDYEMEFDNPRSFNCTFRCRCGDIAESSSVALSRMRRSRLKFWLILMLLIELGFATYKILISGVLQ